MDLHCYVCKKRGHTKKDCPDRKWDLTKAPWLLFVSAITDVRAQVTKEFDAGAASQMPEIQQLDLSDGKGKALGGRELEIQETKSGGSRKAPAALRPTLNIVVV